VERVVKVARSKRPPIEPRVELERVIKPDALRQIKSPVICSGPSRAMVPVAEELMRTSPLIVEHPVYCAASACELMVAVA
jgi:hypothetical protein